MPVAALDSCLRLVIAVCFSTIAVMSSFASWGFALLLIAAAVCTALSIPRIGVSIGSLVLLVLSPLCRLALGLFDFGLQELGLGTLAGGLGWPCGLDRVL